MIIIKMSYYRLRLKSWAIDNFFTVPYAPIINPFPAHRLVYNVTLHPTVKKTSVWWIDTWSSSLDLASIWLFWPANVFVSDDFYLRSNPWLCSSVRLRKKGVSMGSRNHPSTAGRDIALRRCIKRFNAISFIFVTFLFNISYQTTCNQWKLINNGKWYWIHAEL